MEPTTSESLMKITQWDDFPKTNQFWVEEKTREISFGACWGSNGERDYMRQIALDALNYNNEIVENCLWKIISLIDNVDNIELINIIKLSLEKLNEIDPKYFDEIIYKKGQNK